MDIRSKETASVISSDPSCAKTTMSYLERYHWKPCLMKCELDINVLVSVIFICGFSAKVTCAFLIYEKQWRLKNLTEINIFRVRKTTVSSTFLTGLRFQGYRCKSLHWCSLKFTLTVPLRWRKKGRWNKYKNVN